MLIGYDLNPKFRGHKGEIKLDSALHNHKKSLNFNFKPGAKAMNYLKFVHVCVCI